MTLRRLVGRERPIGGAREERGAHVVDELEAVEARNRHRLAHRHRHAARRHRRVRDLRQQPHTVILRLIAPQTFYISFSIQL